MPTRDWDGKIVLAAIYVGAYFALAVYVIKFGGLSSNQKDLALVVLAATSPQLTQIFTSLFRTTAADERQAALRSGDLRSAIETPAGAPDPKTISESVATGVSKALADAEPVEVTPRADPGARRPMAADRRPRDWLDDPLHERPEPSSPALPDVAPGTTPVMED